MMNCLDKEKQKSILLINVKSQFDEVALIINCHPEKTVDDSRTTSNHKTSWAAFRRNIQHTGSRRPAGHLRNCKLGLLIRGTLTGQT